MNPIAEAAAFLAQSWPVFPCGPDKKPVTEHGFKDATTEPAAVRALFRRPGATLIGVPTGEASDLAVIDLDVKDGASGLEWLAANQHRLPATRRHRTRSGGVHLLFRYPAGRRIRNSASKVAPGVDVRGHGGYIIAPPSDGYTIADDAMPADMPAWLVDLLDPPVAAPAPRPTVTREWRDTSAPGSRYGIAALSDETDAICNAPFGQQETTLNAAGLKIGALIAGGELEATYARETLIRAGLAMASEPGKPAWHAEEIRRKVERAIADGSRNPRQAPQLVRRVTEEFAPPEPPPRDEMPDYWAEEPTPEPSARDIMRLPKPEAREGDGSGDLPLVFLGDIAPCLDAKDFVEGVLIEQSAAVIYGESNAGKTFFATDLALSVAAGLKWFGKDVESGGVVYCVLEGGFGFRNRVKAWLDFNGQPTTIPFAAIPSSINLLNPDADTPRLIKAIEAAKERLGVPIKLVVIDTLARAFAGGNENSSEDMGQLVLNMDKIRQRTGAAVLFIHHSGKDQAKGARGHSSLRAAIDTEIEVKAPEDEGARTATVAKQRELPKGEVFAFGLKVVELGQNKRRKPVTTCVITPADKPADTGPKLSDGTKKALSALDEVTGQNGQAPMSTAIPKWARVVRLSDWRREFLRRSGESTEAAAERAFSRARKYLESVEKIGIRDGWVWRTDANKSL